MADVAAQPIPLTGLVNATYSAASAGGDTFTDTGKEVVHVKNNNAASLTVTVDSIQACDQGADHDLPIVIPAGQEAFLPILSVARFADPTTKKVTLSWSVTPSVTFAVIKYTTS